MRCPRILYKRALLCLPFPGRVTSSSLSVYTVDHSVSENLKMNQTPDGLLVNCFSPVIIFNYIHGTFLYSEISVLLINNVHHLDFLTICSGGKLITLG